MLGLGLCRGEMRMINERRDEGRVWESRFCVDI